MSGESTTTITLAFAGENVAAFVDNLLNKLEDDSPLTVTIRHNPPVGYFAVSVTGDLGGI